MFHIQVVLRICNFTLSSFFNLFNKISIINEQRVSRLVKKCQSVCVKRRAIITSSVVVTVYHFPCSL